MEKHVNRKLGELPFHQLLQQLNLNDFLWDSDALSLYPSAMVDEKSIYPNKETGYAFTKQMNDELIEKIKNQTFTQGNVSLKIKHHIPKNLIVQHLSVKERVKNYKLIECAMVLL